VPSRVEAAEESSCNATAIRKATRRMTQLYDDALARPDCARPSTRSLKNSTGRPTLRPPWVSWRDARARPLSAWAQPAALERDGLIALVAGDDDRRRRRVGAHHAGTRKFVQARQGWKLAQDRFNDVFGESAAAKTASHPAAHRTRRAARHANE